MIDIKLLREDPDRVRASQRARGEDEGVVDAILAAEQTHRSSLTEFEQLRAQQKSMGKQVAQAQGEEKQALLAQTKELVGAGQGRCRPTPTPPRPSSATLIRQIGNIVEDGVPGRRRGRLRRASRRSASPPEFDFEPRDHLALGRAARAPSTWSAAPRSAARGSTSSPASAPGSSWRCCNMGIAQAVEHGFTPMITPTLVKADVMAGAGFIDKHADEVYRLEADDLYLTGTSEVALAGYHADEILDLSDGPMRYAGWSACYRREAGSHGKDTRGIIRVHQFHKVEMFTYCRVEDAAAEHQRLLGWEKEMLAKIEVPYRVIDTAAGDLGGPGGAQVRLRGVGADPGPLPRADLDLQLHDLPGAPAQHPRARPERPGHPGRRHAQRHARHDPLDRRHPGEPPAGRRLGRRAQGAAAVPRRARRPQAGLTRSPGSVDRR